MFVMSRPGALGWWLLLLTAACTQPPATAPSTAASRGTQSGEHHTPALRAVALADWPSLLDDGDRPSLEAAVDHSLGWLRRQPAERTFTVAERSFTSAMYASALEDLLAWLDAGLGSEQLAAEVAHRFALYETAPSSGRMLITGYYEPILAASLERRAGYDVPLWGRPRGMVRADLGAFAGDLAGRSIVGRLKGGRLVPFPARSASRTAGVPGARVLAWARDPIDAFFLEVQGSGSLRLPSGELLRIGYAAQNGHPYRSIGRLLIDQGKVTRARMSMQAIRSYLEAHPAEINSVLDHNPSVVFFRLLKGPPVGNLGVPVVPGRSIATDQRIIPPGALCYLDTERPTLVADGTTVADGALQRFVLNQDTGGAIRGPGRADFFWGRGVDAAARAGAMKQPGRLLIFVPREATQE